MRRLLAAALVALVLAVPSAAAHTVNGTRVERTVGPYHVVFRTSPNVLAGQASHVSWEVTNRSSNRTYDDNATAQFTYYDPDNVTLTARQATAIATPFEDTTVLAAEHRPPEQARWMDATVQLPEARATFGDHVHPTASGPDDPPSTPLVLSTVVAALAAAALLRR